MLKQGEAQAGADRIAEDLIEPLHRAADISRQVVKDLGERDVNNMYLYDNAVEVAVLADLLRAKVRGLVGSVDTVSWREG